jgi:carbon-monoxide dehydrogenase large subunit
MVELTNPLMGLLALPGLFDPWHWALAVDRVRFVGDPVAIVIATSRAVAEDGCELIDVEYEAIDPVTSVEQALDPSRPNIWSKAQGNVMYENVDTHGDIEASFGRADAVVRVRFDQHRQANQPIETRGCIAEVDPTTCDLTFHAAHQSAHFLRWALGLWSHRQSTRTSMRELLRRRSQIKNVVDGTRAFVRANPSVLRDTRPLLPVLIKQALRDPRRFQHLGRSLLGLLARDVAHLPHVVVGDIGGSFGAKSTVLREEIAVCAAANHFGRSVKWIEDRNEHLVAGGQARDESIEVEAAVLGDGTLLGLRAHLRMDGGAYPAIPYGAPMFARMIKTMIPGPYRLPAIEFRTTLTFSNKATYVAYRGPWAAETWVRERLLDVIARQLDVGRDEVRRRNLLREEDLPTVMVTGPKLDVRMSARATFERAMELAEFDRWEECKRAGRQSGKRLGLGFATYIEAAPGPPGYLDSVAPGFAALVGTEPASAVLTNEGSITIHTSQVPHGQGHETTLSQLAADELGVGLDDIRIRYGNTRHAPFSLVGTGGSRSAAMAGGAVALAARSLRAEIVKIAAELLEAAPEDIVVEGGRVHVAGVPSAQYRLADVAAAATRQRSTGFTGTRSNEAIRVSGGWSGGEGGWAQATHVCWVEVDIDTGLVRIPRYIVVEDCGEVINPAIVDGQIRGGVAQGVGAVLYEKTCYDEAGQIQSGTFMDYLLPTVCEIPDIEIHHIETPSTIAFNYRGVGEGGMIGAPAAITNAIEDALSDLGVRITEQHLPPSRILELAHVIRSTRRTAGAR